MTDELAVETANNSGKEPRGKPFKKGADNRRNLKGRPHAPKSAKELNKLLLEIAAEDVVNPNTGEQVQRLRAMLRSMMTGRQSADKVHILDRLYGKVPQSVALTGADGGAIETKVIDDTRFDRAISSLADALRKSVPGESDKQAG
jgi:hypothetical protein